jgi:hypothetical protein
MKLVAAAVALASVAGTAHADAPLDRPEAFEVDREVPPPGQVEFSFDGGAHVEGWALSAQLGYLDRPFRLHTVDVKIFPVNRRETLALGGSIAIGPAILFDARMPFIHQSGDRMQGLGDDRPLDANVLGDMTIGGRLRLTERERYSAFVRLQLALPTGDDFDFAGEARFTAAWMLIGRLRLPQNIVVAGTAGVRFRGREVIVADRLLGDELFAAVGASLKLPAISGLYCDDNDVRLTVELHGVLGSSVGDREGAHPAEVRAGVASKLRPWLALAVRLGKGIDDHIGAPRLRAMAELAYIGGAR